MAAHKSNLDTSPESMKMLIEHIVFLKRYKAAILDILFDEKVDPEHYDPSFNKRLYGKDEFSRNVIKPKILQLDLFDVYNKTSFEQGDFKTYMYAARTHWGDNKIFASLISFAFHAADHDDVIDQEKFKAFVKETAISWYRRRVLWTVWQGKQKEWLMGEAIQKKLPEGWMCLKTTEAQDKKYMMDFMIKDDTFTPRMGISVKGETYERAKASGKSDWLNEREPDEIRGQQAFTKTFGCGTMVLISSIENKQKVDWESEKLMTKLFGRKKEEELFTF